MTINSKKINVMIRYKGQNCPNCFNIFPVKHGRQKYCSLNCAKRYWDKKNRIYYKNYYIENIGISREYYQRNKKRIKLINHNIYEGKKEVKLTV